MKVPTLNDELRPGKAAGWPALVPRRALSLSVNQGGGFFRPRRAHAAHAAYMQASRRLFPRWANAPAHAGSIFGIFTGSFQLPAKQPGLIEPSTDPCSIRALWPMPIQLMKILQRCCAVKFRGNCGAGTLGEEEPPRACLRTTRS